MRWPRGTIYVLIQEHLADLRLAERRHLGAAFRDVIEQAAASGTGRRQSLWLDRKPDFLYMFAAGVERARAMRSGPKVLWRWRSRTTASGAAC